MAKWKIKNLNERIADIHTAGIHRNTQKKKKSEEIKIEMENK